MLMVNLFVSVKPSNKTNEYPHKLIQIKEHVYLENHLLTHMVIKTCWLDYPLSFYRIGKTYKLYLLGYQEDAGIALMGDLWELDESEAALVSSLYFEKRIP